MHTNCEYHLRIQQHRHNAVYHVESAVSTVHGYQSSNNKHLGPCHFGSQLISLSPPLSPCLSLVPISQSLISQDQMFYLLFEPVTVIQIEVNIHSSITPWVDV